MRRRKDRGEAIHQRLEAELRERFEDPRALRAYAESLHARGDPLGEVMLLSLRGAEYERQQHRAMDRDAVQLGDLQESTARRRAGELIRRHWHDWFGDLDEPDLDLEWKHGLVTRLWLGYDSKVRSLNRVLRAPPLRFLQRLDAGELIGQLRPFTVLPTLREVTLPATAALDMPERLVHLGRGLTLTGSQRELLEWRDQLRRSFPGVRLKPRLPVRAIDADFIGPEANPEPKWAGQGPTECARTMEDKRPFRFCAACASDDTTLLAALPDPYVNRTSVTYEYVCRECGWFTWYAILDIEPVFPKKPRSRLMRRAPKMRLAS